MNAQTPRKSCSHVPVLAMMRDFYLLPRVAEIRFPQYLALIGTTTETCLVPLIRMNPMAKEHINDVLDHLIACAVDEDAHRWVETMAQRLALSTAFCHGFAVVDDIGGGWTARVDVEMACRFVPNPTHLAHWCITTIFASQSHTNSSVEREVSASMIRRRWQMVVGTPRTLREMLAQEQIVMQMTKQHSALRDDIYQEQAALLTTILDETAYPMLVAAIFGDVAAASLGYQSQGFVNEAGLAYVADPATPLLMPNQQQQFLMKHHEPSVLRIIPQ